MRRKAVYSRQSHITKEAMQSIVFEQFGDPREVLRVRDVPMAADPASGEVRVRMRMSPINPSDLMTSSTETAATGPSTSRSPRAMSCRCRTIYPMSKSPRFSSIQRLRS
jgi:hypothetical protein